MLEDQHKDKNVVHAQRILDEIAGQKIEAGLRSFNVPDEPVKSERQQHPQYTPPGGRAHAQFPPAVFETDKIDNQRDEDADVKGNPKPDARRHRAEVFMWGGARQPQIARSSHVHGVSAAR